MSKKNPSLFDPVQYPCGAVGYNHIGSDTFPTTVLNCKTFGFGFRVRVDATHYRIGARYFALNYLPARPAHARLPGQPRVYGWLVRARDGDLMFVACKSLGLFQPCP